MSDADPSAIFDTLHYLKKMREVGGIPGQCLIALSHRRNQTGIDVKARTGAAGWTS